MHRHSLAVVANSQLCILQVLVIYTMLRVRSERTQKCVRCVRLGRATLSIALLELKVSRHHTQSTFSHRIFL